MSQATPVDPELYIKELTIQRNNALDDAALHRAAYNQLLLKVAELEKQIPVPIAPEAPAVVQ